jgi:transposase
LSIKQALGSLDLGSVRGLLMSLYHGVGPGRKPYDPVNMLKAQLLKHLFRVPSDRAREDRRVAEACGFRDKTPSHGLFTQFKHRLGSNGYERVVSALVNQLLSDEVAEDEVVALDSTASVHVCS